MAIQVSGTTVIDNSRNLSNIQVADINSTLSIQEVKENAPTATDTSGTRNMNLGDGAVVYCTSNQTGNRTINFRWNSTTSLDSQMSTGEAMTCAVLLTNGSTAYYVSTVQIDGGTVTPKWVGGAPTEGTASSIEAYSFTIIKTGAATFTVLASKAAFE